jgi:hypothetical protein
LRHVVADISLLRRDWNVNAKMENMKVYQAAGMLVTMRSVDRRPNAQVPLNQPIAQFPQTADGVSQLNGTIAPLSASLVLFSLSLT